MSVTPTQVFLPAGGQATITVDVDLPPGGQANVTAEADGGADTSNITAQGESAFIDVEVYPDLVGRLDSVTIDVHSSERNVTITIYDPSGNVWKQYGVTLNKTGSWRDSVAEVMPPGGYFAWEDKSANLGTVKSKNRWSCTYCYRDLPSLCRSKAEAYLQNLEAEGAYMERLPERNLPRLH